MKVTISNKALTILPYLSTSWDNITAIYAENAQQQLILCILLKNGNKVEIPHLSESAIEQILRHHSKHLEEEAPKQPIQQSPMQLGFPMQIGEEGMQMMGSAMQHDPSQSDAPELPKEILDKISKISSIIDSDALKMTDPVENCNCIYCQVARALGSQSIQATGLIEEEIKDEDLSFRTWDIEQKEDNLYIVSNPLDPNEQYQVFLGKPIGCTCGKNDCEHIQAVLKS